MSDNYEVELHYRVDGGHDRIMRDQIVAHSPRKAILAVESDLRCEQWPSNRVLVTQRRAR